MPPFVAALVLAAVHLIAGRLRFLSGTPRSRWLSGAAGVSVAYVFLHLLPELEEHQKVLGEAVLPGFSRHIYVLGLTGLVFFYALERAVRQRRRDEGEHLHEGAGLFWVHLGSFAFYNLAVGYLLTHREDATLAGLGLYTLAMALHFVVVDFALRTDHRDAYERTARWVLAAALLAGWGLGWGHVLPASAVFAGTGFLAGGIVLNVLKEELPEERESRLWAFVAGAAGYAVLLLAA